MRLETDRLVLRVPRLNEAESLAEAIGNPEIVRYLSSVPWPYTTKHARQFIQKQRAEARKKKKSSHGFSIQLRGKSGIVGGIGFHDYDEFHRSAEIGYWLAEPLWRQGYMSEAVEAVLNYGFKELGLNRVTLRACVENKGSNAVARKFGFQLEGTSRKALKSRIDRRYHNFNIYGLLREDWKRRR